METITLRTDLQELLEKDAEIEGRSVSEIVNEAVGHYLKEQQRAKLEREITAYEAMHTSLKNKYLGQWVAIHEQTMVDHDPDRQTLYRRVRKKYSKTPVLIREITETSQADLWIRTPSTGKLNE